MTTGSKHRLIGRCIYCGAQPSAEYALSDEHIFPYGLGGKQMLLKASCSKCADITSRFEGKVQREDLLGLRTAAGFPTRHKKDRPKTLKLKIRRGKAWIEVDVPTEDYVPVISVPTFRSPAYPDDSEYTEGIQALGYYTCAAKRDYECYQKKIQR